MSGRITPAQAAEPPPLGEPGFEDMGATPPRLLLALALSCMLHAAVVFLPYLGMSTRAGRLAPTVRGELPTVLDAQLLDVGARAQPAAAESPASGPEQRAYPPAASPAPVAPEPVAPHRAEGADLLPLAAPVYYSTDQLSKRPQPHAAAELDAPQIRPIVASGKIVLTLWINEFGAVTDVAVERSDLPEVFGRSAVAAFKALRFDPGERNGQPVATIMRVEVNYDDSRLKSD